MYESSNISTSAPILFIFHLFVCLFINTILVSMKWYFIVVIEQKL